MLRLMSSKKYRLNHMRLWYPKKFIAMFQHCKYGEAYGIETFNVERCIVMLPEGGTAIDIGASGGIFTAAFALKAGEQGKVFAFEPCRTLRHYLQQTVKYNALKNVTVVASAISNRKGEADFHELPATELCTWRPEVSALEFAHPVLDANKYRVELTTLDDYFADYDKPIHLIKMDIEGFEVHAIHGGMKLITKHRPFLSIDVHRHIGGVGTTRADIEALLTPLNYRIEAHDDYLLLCYPG